MANAKTVNRGKQERILVYGPPGSGKSKLMLTLPGKKFVYMFDPAGMNAIAGFDIDYEYFAPNEQSLAVHSLSSDEKRKKVVASAGARFVAPMRTQVEQPMAYRNFVTHVQEKSASDFYQQYDWICIDSLTTLSEIIMDEILYLNGRYGQFPGEDDWGPQMVAIRNVFREFTSYNTNFFCTAHEYTRQDELTKRILTEILVTGQLRVRLPQLFSEIYHTECVSTKEKEAFRIQTRPSSMYPNIRSSIPGLAFYEDVTITDWNQPERQGLGRILARVTTGQATPTLATTKVNP